MSERHVLKYRNSCGFKVFDQGMFYRVSPRCIVVMDIRELAQEDSVNSVKSTLSLQSQKHSVEVVMVFV